MTQIDDFPQSRQTATDPDVMELRIAIRLVPIATTAMRAEGALYRLARRAGLSVSGKGAQGPCIVDLPPWPFGNKSQNVTPVLCRNGTDG